MQYEAEISVHVEQASSEDRLRYKQLSAEYFAVRILLVSTGFPLRVLA